MVKLQGIPCTITTDRDKVFTSHFWAELLCLQGTKLQRSSSYHPHTDGQTKVVNRSVETYLRYFVSDKPKQWLQWLSWAEYWYNTSFHTSAQTTPFQIVYGREPPPIIKYGRNSTSVSSVEAMLEERDAMLEELKSQLLKA